MVNLAMGIMTLALVREACGLPTAGVIPRVLRIPGTLACPGQPR